MLKKSDVLREGYVKGLKAGKEVVSKMLKESYNGQLKVICDLDHYKPWSGAVDTWNKIQDADMVGEFEAVMADMYPDGIEMGQLNDFLWFESESALSMVGLGYGDDEEDNEEITGSVSYDDSDEVLVSSDEEEEGLPTDTNVAVDPEELANCKTDDDVNDLVMDSVINKYGRAMRGCEKIRFIKENKFAVRGIHWVR